MYNYYVNTYVYVHMKNIRIYLYVILHVYHTSRPAAASILVRFSFSEKNNLCPIFVPIFVTKSHSHLKDIKILYKIEIKSIEIVTNKATLIRAQSRQSRQAICMPCTIISIKIN